MKKFIISIFVFLVCSTWSLQAMALVTFTVNDLKDAIDSNPGDGVCETASGHGICSLRAAIMEANALGGGAIDFEPGYEIRIFKLSLVGPDEDEGLTGDLDIKAPITIQGNASRSTIIDGLSLDRVFHIHSTAGGTKISSLKIIQGHGYGHGGGVLVEAPSTSWSYVELNENTVTQNNNAVLPGQGGAIYFQSGSHTITHCSFYKDTAGIINSESGYGGAIYANEGKIEITDSIFESNRAYKFGSGGALYINTARFTITQSTSDDVSIFYDNQAYSGGAIYNTSEDAENTIIGASDSEFGVEFENNTAAYNGGAIHNNGFLTMNFAYLENNAAINNGGAYYQDKHGAYNTNRLNLIQSRLYVNQAGEKGGAIYAKENQINIDNSVFLLNRAKNGGSIYSGDGAFVSASINIQESAIASSKATENGGAISILNKGSLLLANSTLTLNYAENGNGGGIYTDGDSSLKIYFSTLTLNKALNGSGGGIYTPTYPDDLGGLSFVTEIRESLLVHNQAQTGQDCSGSILSRKYNLLTFGADCDLQYSDG